MNSKKKRVKINKNYDYGFYFNNGLIKYTVIVKSIKIHLPLNYLSLFQKSSAQDKV